MTTSLYDENHPNDRLYKPRTCLLDVCRNHSISACIFGVIEVAVRVKSLTICHIITCFGQEFEVRVEDLFYLPLSSLYLHEKV